MFRCSIRVILSAAAVAVIAGTVSPALTLPSPTRQPMPERPISMVAPLARHAATAVYSSTFPREQTAALIFRLTLRSPPFRRCRARVRARCVCLYGSAQDDAAARFAPRQDMF